MCGKSGQVCTLSDSANELDNVWMVGQHFHHLSLAAKLSQETVVRLLESDSLEHLHGHHRAPDDDTRV
jgi:hypothetical protein